jgi:ABC-type Na+ efflux pump permease subunit
MSDEVLFVPDNLRRLLHNGDTADVLLLTLVMLVLLLLIGWIVMTVRLRKLSLQLADLSRGVEGENLHAVLVKHMDLVDQTTRRMDTIEQAVGVLQAQMPGCLQRAHLVRYDAFDDVGGQQSFSVALLNARGDGIVLTSVYSRSDVRVYAKSIENGRSSHALSQEEERALREVVAR